MPRFTKNAIKASFLKLLGEQPLSQISVRDIVEDCGINRNSFYYHFQDIPSLLEEIITDYATELIASHPTVDSLEECFDLAFRFALDNRRAALHIYNSVSRDLFEHHLLKLCGSIIERYMDSAARGVELDARDRSLFIRFLQCECFGACLKWMSEGMKEQSLDDIHRFLELSRGLPDEFFRRSRESSSPAPGEAGAH